MSSLIDAIKADCRAVMEAGQQPPTYGISEVAVPEVITPNPETESAEPGLFVWPRAGSIQERRLQSRLQQLVLRQQSEQSSIQPLALQLETELLKKFQTNKVLHVVDDICLVAEGAFGIGPVSEPSFETDQRKIHECYDLVDLICSKIMADLDFIEQKPVGMQTDFTVRKQVL